MTNATWNDVACPACAAQPGEACWMVYLGSPTRMQVPHAERVEAAAFVASLGDPGQPAAGERTPITEAQILATGEV